MIRQIENPAEKKSIASQILYFLPEWFGIPESTAQYIEDSLSRPFFAAEIMVMGVRPDCHRQGIGTALWKTFRQYAMEKGYLYAQVKTVQEGKYPAYDLTNHFYQKCGFKELELFPSLWDEQNPCQIYVQYLDSRDSNVVK